MTTFKQLGLSPELIQALDGLGFAQPSTIQEKAIPFILGSDNDLIALAQTGTGKTAAFGLPILDKIQAGGKKPSTLILCPTRELCTQISRDIQDLAKNIKGLSVVSVYGGQGMNIQINSLKKGADIVVGTPGRLHDLIRRKALDLGSVKQVVLDEADEMLDMGFKADLDAILEQTPAQKQVLLFSATISKSIYSIAANYMDRPEEISAGEKNKGADNVTHEYYIVSSADRFEALRRILDSISDVYGIIFCRTKKQTQELADKLKHFGYDVECLHGDISQNMRTRIMSGFKRGQTKLLVATDVAARGIDVSDLTHIINYNPPDQNEIYTHRSGRTGRAQKSGISVSILAPNEAGKVKQLEAKVGKEFAYKKVPAGGEVIKKKIDSLTESIKKTNIDLSEYEQYMTEATAELSSLKKSDLIKRFMAVSLGDITQEEQNSRDLNSKAGRGSSSRETDKTEVKINIGKKHKLDIKDFFSLINSAKDRGKLDIGRIRLMPEATIFSVDSEKADRLINNLRGKTFKKVKITAEQK